MSNIEPDHLNNWLRTYEKDEPIRIEVNPMPDEVPSFELFSDSGHAKYSIGNMELFDGYNDIDMTRGVYLFLLKCQDAIIEEWNKKRPGNTVGIKQKKYMIHAYTGILISTHKTNDTQAEHYEIYYSYNQDSQLFYIKCLLGNNDLMSGDFNNYHYKTVVKLENAFGLMDEKVLNRIVRQLKQHFIINLHMILFMGAHKNLPIKTFASALKLKPIIKDQEDFDQDTIDTIQSQNFISFGTYVTLK